MISTPEPTLNWRIGRHSEIHRALQDPQVTPGALCDLMLFQQRRGEARLIKWACGPRDFEIFGQLCAVAQWTVDDCTDMGGSPRFGQYPRPLEEWRLVADVLAVKTRELGDPVTHVILMKANDDALHPLSIAVSAIGCAVAERSVGAPDRRLGGAHSGPSDTDCKLSRAVHPAQIRRAT